MLSAAAYKSSQINKYLFYYKFCSLTVKVKLNTDLATMT